MRQAVCRDGLVIRLPKQATGLSAWQTLLTPVSSRPWAVTVQGYVNAIKPDGAPDWVLRLSVVAAIPLANDQ